MKLIDRFTMAFAFSTAVLCLPCLPKRTADRPHDNSHHKITATSVLLRRTVASTPGEDTIALSFILKNQYGRWHQGFVIQRETVPYQDIREGLSFAMHRRRHPQKEVREAFDNFARRNASIGVAPPLNLDKPLIVVAGKEISAIFKHHWWEEFYQKYPHTDGFLEVALPGYSADGSTALVYITRSSGRLNAEGELILLQKKNAIWTCKETLTGFIS